MERILREEAPVATDVTVDANDAEQTAAATAEAKRQRLVKQKMAELRVGC